jgi:hypothetical protein
VIKSLVQRIIGTSSTRIYVVLGEQFAAFNEPSYSTHPDTYSFPFDRSKFLPESPSVLPPNPFELPIGTEREKGPSVIKVFSRAKDAIRFAYCCNLASVNPSVFERIEEEWVYSKDQSAFDINW